MTDYDPEAEGAPFYSRVITPEEINALPRLPFAAGIGTSIFLSQQRDDARRLRRGYCYQQPDRDDYHWDQTNFAETHYYPEGKIRRKRGQHEQTTNC